MHACALRRNPTCVADGEAGELARGAVGIAAARDQRRDEAGSQNWLQEGRVEAAQVADHVARARAHLALTMLQQRAQQLCDPPLPAQYLTCQHIGQSV